MRTTVLYLGREYTIECSLIKGEIWVDDCYLTDTHPLYSAAEYPLSRGIVDVIVEANQERIMEALQEDVVENGSHDYLADDWDR